MDRIAVTQLLTATGGEASGFEPHDLTIAGVEIDSREVQPGELFWAVQGENQDGHNYTHDALSRGAVACVVERNRAAAVAGPKILVENTRRALSDFARWYRQSQDVLVIGVTGSVGKTTTREMIHAALAAGFAGTRSPRNFNNHFGLPLSILEIERKHEFAVLELGASAVGEIRDLAGVALPEVGVITAIGLAHYEKFGGEQQILSAKGELVEALPSEGFAVLAGDCPRVRSLEGRAGCRVILVGEGRDNDLRATHLGLARNQIGFRVDGEWYELPVVGRHHIPAALAAIAIGREIGMDDEAIAAGLRKFTPAPGRCRVEQIGHWTVIDDTYNASPCSMRAACEILRTWNTSGKRILVTGDMLELGTMSIDCHRDLGKTAAEAGIDHHLVHGRYREHVIEGAKGAGTAPHRLADCESLDALFAVLDCWLEPGDVLLVKGSRSMRMERVIDWLREQHQLITCEHIARLPTRACA